MLTAHNKKRSAGKPPTDVRSAVRRRNSSQYFATSPSPGLLSSPGGGGFGSPTGSDYLKAFSSPFTPSQVESKPLASFFPLRGSTTRESYEQLLLGDWESPPVRKEQVVVIGRFFRLFSHTLLFACCSTYSNRRKKKFSMPLPMIR